jgi:hypothetical protein
MNSEILFYIWKGRNGRIKRIVKQPFLFFPTCYWEKHALLLGRNNCNYWRAMMENENMVLSLALCLLCFKEH